MALSHLISCITVEPLAAAFITTKLWVLRSLNGRLISAHQTRLPPRLLHDQLLTSQAAFEQISTYICMFFLQTFRGWCFSGTRTVRSALSSAGAAIGLESCQVCTARTKSWEETRGFNREARKFCFSKGLMVKYTVSFLLVLHFCCQLFGYLCLQLRDWG